MTKYRDVDIQGKLYHNEKLSVSHREDWKRQNLDRRDGPAIYINSNLTGVFRVLYDAGKQ